jgi:hypothetical protein
MTRIVRRRLKGGEERRCKWERVRRRAEGRISSIMRRWVKGRIRSRMEGMVIMRMQG